ncbi:phosphatidylinositol N-acetylglucosaminyltransferase subunit H [Caerostris darwini]|uniref:Phosphatidylinositol N-acetylglucosaminyltransferase subunit H n=1 Tax=Caerostris darwini TaxID=1538125 RepID=A0AAV4NJ50_9ARAC|nr:phosphatidylinositol N-acetylglucosaminyltransferase subunit H [Caerostris darwini]
MCQQKRSNTVEQRTHDIYGNPLQFYAITHDGSIECKEYVISKETFNFKRWLIFMIIFSSLAFYCEFYNVDANFLSIFLFFLCAMLILKLHLKVKQESLLVIASIGLQLTTTFVTGRKESQFIFNRNIYDVVINEGMYMHRIIFYLAVLLRDIKDPLKISSIVPLFQHTFPRLDSLQKIYNGIQNFHSNHFKSDMRN